MSWRELVEQRRQLVERVEGLDKDLDDAEEQLKGPGAAPHLPRHAKDLRNGRQALVNGIQQIDAEFQMRPALSFGCLCFVLVGCPVGIWFSRSDYLSAFITCFLPIVFVYYPLMLCGTNFAKEGRFPPSLSVWAADAVVALAGLVLFARLLRN
jgi:lipopolysaccharide export system permease protein